MKRRNTLILLFLSLYSCKQEEKNTDSLFRLLTQEQTGITFRNDLTYTEKVNPYTFRNFYNGAGVALGDINKDGLVDIFLAGNQTSNRLYLNQGNLQFKDITDQAGLNSSGFWSTGISMADINGDGLLDIYVCKSGPQGGKKRHNELYINNGDLTFTEKSKDFGLAEERLSQHAVFFDFDKDGDLDMYLLSNSGRSVGIFDLREGQREIRDPDGGNKLFRNDGEKFTDVSEEAGIYGSSIGYGLGVTVADLNDDNWPDLYVSNDFFERDYLYLNNQDGTFSEVLTELLPEISMGSMGADIADLNNDGRPDIFVTEMLPNELARVKTKTPFEEWDKYQSSVKAGYHHQFTRNTLQRNLGFRPGTKTPVFSEVSRMAGVEATDWSWGALIFDMDNDGRKDIFVANGIVKDLTDFDFVDFYVNNQEKVKGFREDSVLLTKMIDAFPSNPQANFLFKNLGNWNFENLSQSTGLDQLTFSTGSAYGDLDNDGDLDLVINNLNGPVFLYQNTTSETKRGNYLSIELGSAFGSKVMAFSEDQTFFQEYQPVKGYMSSVDPRIHFGLGKAEKLDSIQILWPDGKIRTLKEVRANQALTLSPEPDDKIQQSISQVENQLLLLKETQIPFRHQESDFVDFDRDRLRFWMISNEGPKAAKADVNGDGLEDLFIPGAKGQTSALLLQSASGEFRNIQPELFEIDAIAEDVTAHFFDANGDGKADLIVGSGGIEFGDNSGNYSDRLYLNDGHGTFQKSPQVFSPTPTSFILSSDLDNDGDQDLIIGCRAVPFGYGIPCGLQIWENDGKGNFTEITSSLNAELLQLGMLTSGALADLDGDGKDEIIIAGEWMPIRIFAFQDGKLIEKSSDFGFEKTRGLWNCLLVEDVNGDGKPDILAGNHGLNSRLRTNPNSELRMIINDYDQNGTLDHILSNYENSKSIPLVLKPALIRQIPSLRKQLLTYESYQNKSLEELFPQAIWANSLTLQADMLETSLWINEGQGKFLPAALPIEVQSAPVYSITALDGDLGSPYLIFGGNQSRIKPELGSQMGSYGWVLKPEGKNQWIALLPQESGLFVPGEIRQIFQINIENKPNLVVLRNNDTPLVFEIRY
ncbi:VCBS repeat-containing protein [Algoriphagus boritolerans]|uniref:Repeat domain-containing protein n=1 Tax=Algoriphagus boritolerans DSM 17298 = JCM 18970 TaxID=1120964 RepID=A0A1H5T1M1_9BACT|nr:VCBS repeat-containing protein [Algoriphagus boritolerans]SEF55991.1 Repeat domain-containing protein [Algoriphagus boritolerans DSM 17298 = JCM 18970]